MIPDVKLSPVARALLVEGRDSDGKVTVKRGTRGCRARRDAAWALIREGLLDLRGLTLGRDPAETFMLTREGEEVARVVGAA